MWRGLLVPWQEQRASNGVGSLEREPREHIVSLGIFRWDVLWWVFVKQWSNASQANLWELFCEVPKVSGKTCFQVNLAGQGGQGNGRGFPEKVKPVLLSSLSCEKRQAKARRNEEVKRHWGIVGSNLINASKQDFDRLDRLWTLRVWISRGFLGMLFRYPGDFFNLSSERFAVVGMFRLHFTVLSVISGYIISTCFSATFPIQLHVASKHRRVPLLGDLHRKAEALSSGWSRHSFLRPGDVQNFVFNVSKMWLHRPLSLWSFLQMQFGWPFKQIGDWGWKGRKGQSFSLVWFYQSGHVTSTYSYSRSS